MTDVAESIAAVHRSDWGRIVAGLIRRTGDWTLAEDAVAVVAVANGVASIVSQRTRRREPALLLQGE